MAAQRITAKNLTNVIAHLNKLTGNPLKPYELVGDKHVSQRGNYHLSGAYGGWALHQMVGEGGGIRDVLQSGHVPAKQLYNLIHAYIRGLEAGGYKDGFGGR